MYYLNTFLLFSILGHFIETVFFMVLKINKKSGFLFLWWTPLYGIGAVISLIIYKIISKRVNNKLWKNILLIGLYFLIFTLLEITGGILIEKIFHYEMWNYEDVFWNIGKYASVPTSSLWTLIAFVYIYVIKKATDFFIKKIPKVLSILLIVVFILDCACSVLKIWF